MSKFLLDDYIDSLCEIRTSDNCLLGTGKVSDVFSDGDILIKKKNDDLPRLPFKSNVKISIANYKLGSLFLTGEVYLSNMDEIRFRNISILSENEKRKAFRLNYSGIAPVYKDSERPPMPPLEIVHLVNISLTGFLFSCTKELSPKEQYILELEIKGQKMFFHFLVVREVPSENKFHNYGCMFYNVDGKAEDKLLSFIQELQREDIRKVKKT